MQKSLLRLLGFACALALSAKAFAVGLGGINVASGLGQPLKAEIELVAVSKAEKASLVARLAPPDAYKDAGLDYPYGSRFKFQIESRATGEPYLKVSTEQPIQDPFVIMLVELSWSSGKLLREYTFLLDPPGYVAEQPAEAAMKAIAPEVQAAPAAAPVPPAEQVPSGELAPEVTPIAPPVQPMLTEISAASAPMEQPAEAAVSAPPAQAALPAAEKLPELDEWIVIKRGDTMREVADQYKSDDISLDRMLVALYRANANHFDSRNMNRIKAGKILRLPHQDEIQAVSQFDAVREIRAQAADWNSYRQKLASAATIRRQSQEAQQIATGRISSSVADKTPVARESAKEVLKLSRGEAPGDATAAGAGGRIQEKLNAAQEEIIAKDKALREERERIAMLEKQVRDLRRLEELKPGMPQVKTEAAALAQSAKPATPAAPAAGAASAVVAASGVGQGAEKAKPKPKVVEPEPLMDQILGEPLYLAGGAGMLIVLAGLGVLIWRKKKAGHEVLTEGPSAAASDVGSTTGRLAAPVVPSPDTGDFTGMGAAKEAAPSGEDIDPLAEADLFLNFGRDAQAEEILKEALQNTPNDHRIHLKLLGIYANRVETDSFAAIARQLKDSGDEEAWQQAMAMGLKLEPNNPMYGGAGAVEAAEGADATQLFAPEAAPGAPAVDFELGATPTAASPEETPLAFDVSAPLMDFNVAAAPSKAAQPEPALPEAGGGLMFDVGTSFMPPPAPEPVKPAEAGGGAMEFTLDFPIETPAEKPAPAAQAQDIGLAGINLNFGEPLAAVEAAPAGKDEHWQEIATKLDLAKAYQEMGDVSGAREILEEVMRDGDAGQREAAQSLLSQLG